MPICMECNYKFQFIGLRCRGGYNGSFGFPLWGKLSPQVTDEGATSGYFSLIRRVPRHLPPKGKAFPGGLGVTPPYRGIKITGQSVGAVIDRPSQPSLQINLTGKRHGRAMLAPTNLPVFPGQHKKSGCRKIPRRGWVGLRKTNRKLWR